MHGCHCRCVPPPALEELATALKALYRLSGSARVHAATVAAAGVSVTQSGLRFLSLVADAGPISGTRLAHALDLTQPTASRVLQQLEADGLVARQSSDTDARTWQYIVTPRGQKVLKGVYRYHVDQLESALSDVDAARRRALAGAVTELVQRLHREAGSTRRSA